MVHIIIGIAAITWGVWRMLPDWMFVGEILKIMAYLGLVGFGVIAVLAGLRRFRTNK